ncbi:dipeptidase [Bifidobacterium sp.]|jgi:membrane dipeptidase|uniref:dipeptidase n=1 Tax=Bifidobacterium sp. TaxID=41200 RepID=UPI0025BEB146|nr:dipeptidase [Bifidobacterium sp.]MCH4209351.1 dipeptidase [Bifidobacterium sp.]MCI1224145.1 dipeptidase [Bifidobacterium sp.]
MNEVIIPVIDGHNDLPWESRANRGYSVEGIDQELEQTLHTDIPKLRRGGYLAQFWSAYVHSDFEGGDAVIATLEQIDFIHRMCARYPGSFKLATSAKDVLAARDEGRIASLIGIEGGHQIANNMAVLREYARLGVRYMTMTWNNTNEFADASVGEHKWHGLNDRGREIVAEMNRIGMIVDLAHVSPDTMRDALEASQLPVMFSHSSCFSVNPHPRNVPEDVQHMLAENGGVQMITAVPGFVSAELHDWYENGEHGPRPAVTVGMVADHIEAAREAMGVDYVGVGGDFDGTDAMPEGLSDVGEYQNLFAELRSRGWSEEDLNKLGWKNALRVLKANDGAYRAFMAAGE